MLFWTRLWGYIYIYYLFIWACFAHIVKYKYIYIYINRKVDTILKQYTLTKKCSLEVSIYFLVFLVQFYNQGNIFQLPFKSLCEIFWILFCSRGSAAIGVFEFCISNHSSPKVIPVWNTIGKKPFGAQVFHFQTQSESKV